MDEAAKARAKGENGQMRRLLAEARVLLAGGIWDANAEYVASLAIRPRVMVWDPSQPLELEIGQRFAAAAPPAPRQFALGLRRRGSADVVWQISGRLLQADLAESPFRTMLLSRTLADGQYDLVLRIGSREQPVGDAVLGIAVVNGLLRDLGDISGRSAKHQFCFVPECIRDHCAAIIEQCNYWWCVDFV